jgi:hypothetical protein
MRVDDEGVRLFALHKPFPILGDHKNRYLDHDTLAAPPAFRRKERRSSRHVRLPTLVSDTPGASLGIRNFACNCNHAQPFPSGNFKTAWINFR